MRGGREKYDRGVAVSLHAEEGVEVARECKVERACAALCTRSSQRRVEIPGKKVSRALRPDFFDAWDARGFRAEYPNFRYAREGVWCVCARSQVTFVGTNIYDRVYEIGINHFINRASLLWVLSVAQSSAQHLYYQ
jgi:hypothetical protein